MPKGLVARHVEESVCHALLSHSTVVWYDPESAFSRLVDDLELPPGTELRKYSGSYYRLLDEVEPVFARLSRGSVPREEKLLVYVPHPQLQRPLDVLLGISEAGTAIKDSLASFARAVLRGRLDELSLEQLLDNPTITLEELDRVVDSGGTEASGILTTIFGPVATHELAAVYLTDPDIQERVRAKKATAILEQMAGHAFGLAAGDAARDDLANRLGRHILLTDFRASLGEHTRIPPLDAIPMPPEKRIAACRQTAEHMRSHTRMRAPYVEIARDVEAEYGLRGLSLALQDARKANTFPFADELCLGGITELATEKGLDEAVALATERRSSFWAQVDDERGFQWEVVLSALRLHQAALHISREVAASRRRPGELIGAYADRDSGWHRLDLLKRVLERDLNLLEDAYRFDELVQRAQQAYDAAASAMAEAVLQAIAEHQFTFGGVPQQADTFHQNVEPRLKREPVAYFLIDALRFEMAADLARQLEVSRLVDEVTLKAAAAVAPTITSVGMAALVPGAERGLAIITLGAGKLSVTAGGAQAADVPGRTAILGSHTGGTTLDLTLQDLVAAKRFAKPAALSAEVSGKELIVVRSTAIDDQGELDSPETAWSTMTQVLGDLKRGIHRLAQAGVRRFVVTADHGFLIGGELTEPMKIDPPGGDTVVLRRRCWIGRGGTTSPGFVRFTAAQLGLGGDLEYAFPKGLGVFKAKGGAASYYHGGLSLQELVVPVLTLTAPAPEGEPPGDTFTLNYGPARITNRLFVVTLGYQKGTVGQPVRRVRCEVLVDGQLVGGAATAQYGFQSGTQEIALESGNDNAVTLMVRTNATAGATELRLLDSDTGVILASKGPIPFEFTS